MFIQVSAVLTVRVVNCDLLVVARSDPHPRRSRPVEAPPCTSFGRFRSYFITPAARMVFPAAGGVECIHYSLRLEVTSSNEF